MTFQGLTNQGSQTNANNTVLNSYTSAVTQNLGGRTETKSNAGNQTTVIGVFKSREDAERAIGELRRQGFTQEEISIISKKQGEHTGRESVIEAGKLWSRGYKSDVAGREEIYDDDITDGALTGGTLGGIGGLLLGAGALAVPGLGPIIAAGPIAGALSGAFAGGIAGGLIDWGIPSASSHRYEQRIAEGGILALIKTSAAKINQAAAVLRQNGAFDVETHNAR